MNIVCKEMGPLFLFKGLEAGLYRQLVNGGIRLGLYDPIKQFYSNLFDKNLNNTPLWLKTLTAMTSGAISITCANPFDVVKVRFQGDVEKSINNINHKPRYRNPRQAVFRIFKDEGWKSL
mmetsp:Transcript_15906/g.34924  ORF Transcript_15906/g.34924 Transcript_15906/m.34924 type:complete len:120 (+) Transcript_15906:81-440(+)